MNRKITPPLIIMLLLATSLLQVSCKKTPFFATEGAILTLSASKLFLTTGTGSTTILVQGFTAGGEALHNHTKVVFTATLGRVEPQEVELIGGSASVTFFAGDSGGIAEIRARSGTITADPDPLQLTIGSAALETLSISATPSSFNPGGGRARIRAYAFDSTGNLLSQIPLVLSSTSGTFENGAAVYYTNADGMVEDFLHVTQAATVKVESGSKTAEVEINVSEEAENQPPSADFSFSPSAPKRGVRVNFNGTLSRDPDGDIVSWQWDFGDSKKGSGDRVSHTFTWEGDTSQTFTVVLNVTDNKGATAVTTRTVTVDPETANQPPTSNFSYSPSTPKKNETIHFNGTLSSDPDGDVVAWHWDFGDGTTKNGDSITHTYTWTSTGNRTFTVILTVTDDAGDQAVSTQTITIEDEEQPENQPPVAQFDYSPTSPGKTETIFFNASASTDPDDGIALWQWDFGDGTDASGEQVTHAFTWSGDQSKTFTVILKVTDFSGASSVYSETVTVKGDDSNIPPVALFTYSPQPPHKDEVVTLNARSSSDSDGTIVSWRWIFGDGSTGSGQVVTHAFTWTTSGNKTFVISLTVTDDKGATNTTNSVIEFLE